MNSNNKHQGWLATSDDHQQHTTPRIKDVTKDGELPPKNIACPSEQ
jgi:hypothetical protein